MIGKTVSHYRIVEKLGEGGMGVVYIAEDTLLHRRVAIKTLNVGDPGKQHFRTRFLREARAVSALSHPHIATIHDYGETEDGQPYIVMELVKGETLSALMASEALTIPRAIEIIKQVAEALAEAHRYGIIHRDIKPSNIAIDQRGDVKVLDFGLAKQIVIDATESAAEELPNTRTREGIIVGTPMYLSPEQALGIDVDARSDLFSLGSVLYECIAGQPAFPGKSDIDICAKVIRDDPPPPSSLNSMVSKELDRVTLKALAKKTDARYQESAEILRDLSHLSEHLHVSTVQTPSFLTTADSESSDHGKMTVRDVLGRRYVRLAVLAMVVALGILSVFLFRVERHSSAIEPTATARDWYDKGVSALHDGAYYTAMKRFAEAIKADPGFALAHARLAESHVELDNLSKANDEILLANTLASRERKLTRQETLRLDAITSVVQRNFKQATERYGQLAAEMSGNGAPAFVDLGRAYEKNEELSKAIESYQHALKLDAKSPAAALRLGVLYGRQQKQAESDNALDTAFNLYEALSDEEGRAEVLYQRGVLLVKAGRGGEARDLLLRALETTMIAGNTHQHIRTLLQLSIASYDLNDQEGAKSYLATGMALAHSNNIENLIIQSLNDLGNYFFQHGQPVEAKTYYEQALQLAQRFGAKRNEARAQFSLGSVYIQQDDPEKGTPYVERALLFYEQGGYRQEMIQSLTLLGQAHDLNGDHERALNDFARLLSMAQEKKDQLQEALAHKNIGTVLSHQERYPEALEHFNTSYGLYNSLDKKLEAGYSQVSRAEMLWRLGQGSQARGALNLAASIAEQPVFSDLKGRIYVVRAGLELSERNFEQAIIDGSRAIKLDDSETKRPAIEAQTLVGVAHVLSSGKRKGLHECEEAARKAEATNDPRLVSKTLLALAEARLHVSDLKGAMESALRAQAIFARAGQKESEWRAFLIAGVASQRSGDKQIARDYLSQCDALLSALAQKWAGEYANGYLNRQDIKTYREQLVLSSSAVID